MILICMSLFVSSFSSHDSSIVAQIQAACNCLGHHRAVLLLPWHD